MRVIYILILQSTTLRIHQRRDLNLKAISTPLKHLPISTGLPSSLVFPDYFLKSMKNAP